jgi:hypothetical protein
VSKCDFSHQHPGEDVEKTLRAADWKVSLGQFSAQGSAQRLSSLDAVASQRRLRVSSDKCDFSVQLSAVARAATRQPTVTAAVQSDKCDFALSLSGVMGNRQALSRIQTRMASDKCDFAVRLQFGSDPSPLFRVSAVASAKCDFQIRQIEIRQAGGHWKTLDVASVRQTK